MRAAAVIVAAGRSTRMGGQDKILAPLRGRPLLLHTLDAFNRCEAIDAIVVVVAPERIDEVAALIAGTREAARVTAIVPGGARRQDSVRAGVDRCTAAEIVAVHDGARPLVTPAIIAAGVALAEQHGAAVAAWPVADTLKRADAAGLIEATVAREGLWAVQTPQVFARTLLLAAHAAATADVTDDAMLVEALGRPVYLYRGSSRNIKVTTVDDLALAEALLTLDG
jgi:2-C-methyl-D-erythritol 4-phosphate cytidylyltransferase